MEILLDVCDMNSKYLLNNGFNSTKKKIQNAVIHCTQNMEEINSIIGNNELINIPKNNSTGADHVLENFSLEEKTNVEEVTKNITDSISILINKDLDLFSSKINQK